MVLKLNCTVSIKILLFWLFFILTFRALVAKITFKRYGDFSPTVIISRNEIPDDISPALIYLMLSINRS
jgi:hypothetical protein